MPEPDRPDVGVRDELAPRTAEPATTFHGDPMPPPCCPACTSRVAEAASLSARVRVLEDALDRGEYPHVVSYHARRLIEQLRAGRVV